MSNEVTPEAILQLGFGFWNSKVLLSAVELGVFSELAKEPWLPAPALTQRFGLHPRRALDFFDALVSLGMLQRNNGLYANTPQTDHFLDKSKPTWIGGMLEICNARLYPLWGRLTENLRAGANAPRENFFSTLYHDPMRLRQFLQGMTGLSFGAAQAIAQKFPWQNHRTFFDIGGAQGALAVQVALAHPHLTGGNFDLPVVGPIFEEYVRSFGLGARLRFQPGDFFKDPMPAADVLVMGHILHDWDLQEKKSLITSAFQALPVGGVLVIFEALIDDERKQNTFGLLSSLNLQILTAGGFGYTGADCRDWLAESGFRQTWVEHLIGPDSMVIGIK